MNRKIVLKQDILAALKKVGVRKGQTIMVHTSLSSLGFVCGGAQVVIEALLESVGADRLGLRIEETVVHIIDYLPRPTLLGDAFQLDSTRNI